MNKAVWGQVGVRLREARSAAKLSQQQVATDFLITRQAVSAWERGESLPTLQQMYEIGQLYGVSLDYLVYGVKTIPISRAGVMRAIFPGPESGQACAASCTPGHPPGS
jgi:transcriptional regulator with XRE-family HTH domain